ncbi:L-lysine 6-transaminase [Synergistaceae bacterium OttesenSCG-928-D05]|nr:L-lysine 6-transaminase [Synergistaceae bacterium OttesenSCG-928-D05]
MTSKCSVAPEKVFSTIEELMLRDGFDIVIDMEKSQGSHIIDACSGTDWLDFYTFFASAPFGMNHPKLATPEFKEKIFRAAINKVANSDIYTQEMAEFVKTFKEVAVPDGYNHLFLIDYGTLAVENTFKVAMDWKVSKLLQAGKITPGEAYAGKKGTKIMHFNEAFHGRSGYTLSVTNTNDPNKHQRFAKFTDWPRVLNPKMTFPIEENLGITEWLEAQAVKQIKQAISDDPDGIAAIVLETIQGEGGDNHFRTEFMQQLRTICDESDIILIFDEVQSGMGITGKMWAWQHHNVRPDIFSFGKKAQICGLVAGPRIDEVEKNCFAVSSRINSTWGGSVVDMVRATKYLEIYRDDKILDYVSNTAGPALYAGLKELEKEFPEFINNVRGKGLMCAYDICCPKLRDAFLKECTNEHMLILGCGSNTVRFRPALNVPLEDVQKGIEISRKAAKKVFKK